MSRNKDASLSTVIKAVQTWADETPKELPTGVADLEQWLVWVTGADAELFMLEISAHVESFFAAYLKEKRAKPPCVTKRPAKPVRGWNTQFGSNNTDLAPSAFIVAVFNEVNSEIFRGLLDYLPPYQRREFCDTAVATARRFSKCMRLLVKHNVKHVTQQKLGNIECVQPVQVFEELTSGSGTDIETAIRECVQSLKHLTKARIFHHRELKTGTAAVRARERINADRQAKSESKKQAARQELLRRHQASPKISKTSILRSMAKVKANGVARWGSLRTLTEFCRDVIF